MYNWTTLNQRVFRKLDFVLVKSECEAIVNCDPGAVERILKLVKVKLEKYNERQSQRPRYDQLGMFFNLHDTKAVSYAPFTYLHLKTAEFLWACLSRVIIGPC